MNDQKNEHAVALGKLKKDVKEQKSERKSASSRLNVAKAREVRLKKSLVDADRQSLTVATETE